METPIQAPVHAFPVAPLCLMTMPEASPVPCVVPSSWEIQVILATVLTSASALNYLHQLKTRRDISEHPAKGRADLRNHRRPECRPCGAGGCAGDRVQGTPSPALHSPAHNPAFKPRELQTTRGRPGLCGTRPHGAHTHGAHSMYLYRFIFKKLIN